MYAGFSLKGDHEATRKSSYPDYDPNLPSEDDIERGAGGLFPRGFENGWRLAVGLGTIQPTCAPQKAALLTGVRLFAIDSEEALGGRQIDYGETVLYDFDDIIATLDPWVDGDHAREVQFN
jgi:hypothetical protein